MKGKKLLSLFLALALALSFVPAAIAADYPDTNDHWAEAAIDRWSDYGIVTGDARGFRPNDNMTRAEAATVLSRLFKLQSGAANTFADVSANQWFYDAINKCYNAGILNGVGDNKMAPDAPLTRETFFVMFARGLGLKEQSTTKGLPADGSSWSTGLINALTDKGYVKGMDGKVNALANINRASVMALLDQTIAQYIDKSGEQALEAGAAGKIVLVAANNVTLKGTTSSDIVIGKGVNGGKATLSGVTAPALIVAADNATVALTNKTTITDSLTVPGKNTTVTVSKDSKIPANATAEGTNSKIVAEGAGGSTGPVATEDHRVVATITIGGKDITLSTDLLTTSASTYTVQQLANLLIQDNTSSANATKIQNAITEVLNEVKSYDGTSVNLNGVDAVLKVTGTAASGLKISAGVNPISLLAMGSGGSGGPVYATASKVAPVSSNGILRVSSRLVLAAAPSVSAEELQAVLAKLQNGETIEVTDLAALGELSKKADDIVDDIKTAQDAGETAVNDLLDDYAEKIDNSSLSSELKDTAKETITSMDVDEIKGTAQTYSNVADAAADAVIAKIETANIDTGVTRTGNTVNGTLYSTSEEADAAYRAAVIEKVAEALATSEDTGAAAGLKNELTTNEDTLTATTEEIGEVEVVTGYDANGDAITESKSVTEAASVTTEVPLTTALNDYILKKKDNTTGTPDEVAAERATDAVDKINAGLSVSDQITGTARTALENAYKEVDPANLITDNGDGTISTLTESAYNTKVTNVVTYLGQFWAAYGKSAAAYDNWITTSTTNAANAGATMTTSGATFTGELKDLLGSSGSAIFGRTNGDLLELSFTFDSTTYGKLRAELISRFSQASAMPSTMPSQLNGRSFSFKLSLSGT